MITYHAKYISLNKLSMITYYIFSDRNIFLTRQLFSDYNSINKSQYFFLYKAGNKNPNPILDNFYYCELQEFYVFPGIKKPADTKILICVSTKSIHTKKFIRKCSFLHFCDILYTCEFGHSLVGSKYFKLSNELLYKLTCTILIFKLVKFLFCIILNHRILCY